MADADGIKHNTLKVNGINMHVAEKGEGPMVLFVHGFPELWYSWRHQILALSDLGYRCVAPDMRGFGDTDAPADASSYTYFHTVGDLVELIAALGEEKVFVVGHDWGAVVAWCLCLFRSDKVRALLNLSVPFWNPKLPPVEALKAAFGEDYYVYRFQVPGEMEAEVASAGGAEKLIAKFFTFFTSAPPLLIPKDEWFNDIPPRPTWISEREFNHYVAKFERTGFTGGLNYYRALDLSWEMMGPWRDAQVLVPTKYVVGDLDLAFRMPGVEDYVTKGGMHKDVPLLEEVVVLPGVGHFLQQEKPDEINNHIYEFIRRF